MLELILSLSPAVSPALSMATMPLSNTADIGAWVELASQRATASAEWIAATYRQQPALVFGVAVALTLPALATTGVIMRTLYRNLRREPSTLDEPPATPIPVIRQRGQLEFSTGSQQNFELRQNFTRIGREFDNDVCLTDSAIHRYHAVIERTPEGEHTIVYVGDPDYDGLHIDGRPTTRTVLTGGEIIQIGSIQLRFTYAPD